MPPASLSLRKLCQSRAPIAMLLAFKCGNFAQIGAKATPCHHIPKAITKCFSFKISALKVF
jgi:hypothetical protein